MHSLGLIIGMVSLTVCCYACTTTPSNEGDKLSVQVAMNVTAKCVKPPEIENVNLLGNWDEETYPQGHTANYNCRPGYFGSRITMTCRKGKWVMLPRNKNSECKKRSCGYPGDTEFSTFELKYGHEFVFGAVVEYSCDEGYQMVSKHKTRICAADGWINQIPHCEARLCPPVTDDSVRVISTVNDDEFTMGHVITLECKNPKDSLNGPSKIHCTANGTWNTDPPTCKASCTIQENDMRKNNIQLKNNRVLHYQENEDVLFECVSGYKISDPAKLMIQCNRGTLNYPACYKIVHTTCGRPPYTEHGEITSSMRNSYHSGSSVKYKCQRLFKIHGHAVISCQGGMWEDPPLCLAPCTTNGKNMSENHIVVMWNKHLKENCVRDDLKRKYAKKCYVQHNSTIQFACLPGYVTSDPNDLISKCNRGTLPYPGCFNGKRMNSSRPSGF